MSRQRLVELDLAKGLAIFLVVLGHVVTGEDPAGNEWYGHVRMLVYEFHMPFFMLLSGAVFQITFRPESAASAWRFIASRAQRLLPAFLIFSIIIWAGKHLAAEFQTVDNFNARGWQELVKIYTSPTTSVARSLWYVYVLLELYILFAIISTVTSGRLLPALAVALVMRSAYQFADVPNILAANSLCEYGIFFVIGAAFARSYHQLMPVIRQHSLLFYGIFASSFLTMLFFSHPWTKGVIGLASFPACLAFASTFTSPRDKRPLLLLSEYAFTIYLMNTLFIGFFKGLLLRLIPWDGPYFVLHFFILLSAGVLGPIAVHRLLFTRIPPFARITK